MKDYYDILDIQFTSSYDEIKKAFRTKAIKYHPDKHFGDEYFSIKFIEIKEAYDILSNSKRKAEYDILYKEKYLKKEEPLQRESNKNKEAKNRERENEDQFFYDPYKPFYSYQDRLQQLTLQFPPKFNHWGEILSENEDFFILPKKIGKIVSGYTDLTKDMQPYTIKQNAVRYLKFTLVGAIISAFIIFVFKVNEPIWLSVWLLIPLIIFVKIAAKLSKFKHTCNFIGINGFAEYKCEGNRDNIVSSFEVNFNDITDLIKVAEIRKKNFQYVNTAFSFVWLKNDKEVHEINDIHGSKENNPERFYTAFWLNTFAEKYWTVYLLDRMENVLETKGHLEFNLYTYVNGNYVRTPYIQLGIGYIKFITSKGDISYNFNDIKKVYTKGTSLFIEHINYEKKFYFFESGNKNGIPLMNLSNRQFFFRAMELLLGYKFGN